MSECKAQIDPIEFGKVQEQSKNSHERVDGLEIKLDKMDEKLDKLKWWIVLGLLASPVANDLIPSGKEVILAIYDGFIKTANAFL